MRVIRGKAIEPRVKDPEAEARAKAAVDRMLADARDAAEGTEKEDTS
jgi:hypothetical protein